MLTTLKNTIAGFANVDGVIFCIDSVQGWSRQSEEHFQAIRNLQINNIFFVLTKTDLLDSPVDKGFLEKKLKSEKLINYTIEEFTYKTSDLKLFQEKIVHFLSLTHLKTQIHYGLIVALLKMELVKL